MAAPTDLQTLLAFFLRDLYAGTVGLTSGVGLSLSDGTSSANSGGLQFASEGTLRFYRSSAQTITMQGFLIVTGGVSTSGASANITVPATAAFTTSGRARLESPAGGIWTMATNNDAIGSNFKVDALPTVTAGGGTSPVVTAGSTPLAGSVNVGSGAPGATITLTWGGTAYPSAPFPVCMNQTTGLAVKATATTTTLVITPQTGNFGASDVISWLCIGAKV